MARRRAHLIAGRPFDLSRHEYLRGIYADIAPQMVITKAAQMGISEYLISWVLWSADERNATGLYVMPTDTHISDFSAARLGPAVEPTVSPYLASRIVAGGEHGADRVGLKRVGDRFIYMRGAKVGPDGRAAQLKSIDADVFVRDEVDEMDPRVKPIVDERIGASAIAEWRAASTPTYAEQGIHAEWLASDQREWHITCEACGLRQPLRLDNLVLAWDELERPVHWGKDAAGAPACVCRKCGAVLDRTGPGIWVGAYPERPVHGYQITGLASGRKSLSDILTGLRSTDDSVRMQTFNQKLGSRTV
jgi:phage terminase large subunit GpA-like protein